MPELDNKGSEKPISTSDAGPDNPTEITSKDLLSDERERQAPDTGSRPDGKALKTSSVAASTSDEPNEEGGTNALAPEQDTDLQEDEY